MSKEVTQFETKIYFEWRNFTVDKVFDIRKSWRMANPALRVIEICGGVEATARLAGRTPLSVRRWAYDRSKGGGGGLVPASIQQTLLTAARKAGCPLRPEHFFEDDGTPTEQMGKAMPSDDTPALSRQGNKVAGGAR